MDPGQAKWDKSGNRLRETSEPSLSYSPASREWMSKGLRKASTEATERLLHDGAWSRKANPGFRVWSLWDMCWMGHLPCSSLQMLQPIDCGQVWWEEQVFCSHGCQQPLTMPQYLPFTSSLVLEVHISRLRDSGIPGRWRLSSTSFWCSVLLTA